MNICSACENDAVKVNIVIGSMVDVVQVGQILITATTVLFWCIVADFVALTDWALIEDLGLNVTVFEVFRGEMNNWILTVSDSWF
mgnify:FL=1